MEFLWVIIILALVFDFINGFHDAANSIATIVSTKVLSPLSAVIWAAMFNFIAYFLFELKVADTVAKTVKLEYITLDVVFAGLIAAIIWNLFTWWPMPDNCMLYKWIRLLLHSTSSSLHLLLEWCCLLSYLLLQ